MIRSSFLTTHHLVSLSLPPSVEAVSALIAESFHSSAGVQYVYRYICVSDLHYLFAIHREAGRSI